MSIIAGFASVCIILVFLGSIMSTLRRRGWMSFNPQVRACMQCDRQTVCKKCAPTCCIVCLHVSCLCASLCVEHLFCSLHVGRLLKCAWPNATCMARSGGLSVLLPRAEAHLFVSQKEATKMLGRNTIFVSLQILDRSPSNWFLIKNGEVCCSWEMFSHNSWFMFFSIVL